MLRPSNASRKKSGTASAVQFSGVCWKSFSRERILPLASREIRGSVSTSEENVLVGCSLGFVAVCCFWASDGEGKRLSFTKVFLLQTT